jgi:hypothetical protein
LPDAIKEKHGTALFIIVWKKNLDMRQYPPPWHHVATWAEKRDQSQMLTCGASNMPQDVMPRPMRQTSGISKAQWIRFLALPNAGLVPLSYFICEIYFIVRSTRRNREKSMTAKPSSTI